MIHLKHTQNETYFIFYLLRLVEHVVPNTTTRIATKGLYAKYTQWCRDEGVPLPAKNNKFGVAVARLFENPEVRQHDTAEAKKQYFYEALQYVSASIRQDYCQRFSFPEHVTAECVGPLLKMHFSTPVFFDHELLEFTVNFNMSNGNYKIVVRGISVDNDKMGLTCYGDLDQVYIDGLDWVFKSLYFCQGRTVNIKESTKSKIPEKHVIGYLGADGQEERCINKWFSRNCLAVLSLTRELGNHTCSKCVHDLGRYLVDADGQTTVKQEPRSEQSFEDPPAQESSTDESHSSGSNDSNNDDDENSEEVTYLLFNSSH